MSSTATSTDQQVVECRAPGCETAGREWNFHHGKYCSNECETRAAGREAIAEYLYSHTVCGTCFRDLKEIEEPKPERAFEFTTTGWTYDDRGRVRLQYIDQTESRAAAIGFQYRTENGSIGEKQRSRRVVTGTVCNRCGNTDHWHHEPLLSDPADIERLADRLDDAVDPHRLHVEYIETKDIDLAAGRALEDDDE